MNGNALASWQKTIKKNIYKQDEDFVHSVRKSLSPRLHEELTEFGEKVVRDLEPLVIENNLTSNLPHIMSYDGIGNKIEKIVHHPSYEEAGNIIYGTRMMERLSHPGGLLEALVFAFLSSQAGEAGHNCPVACSAGVVRVFQKVGDFPNKKPFLEKLLLPSYSDNYTGAQFLTELQGGSDVGQNATLAEQDSQGVWHITGEKWFCSNADAELMLVTARYDENIPGTKGLGLFLVPAALDSGERNHYFFRRLKDKIGTRSMATAEIDFKHAVAIPMGPLNMGFKLAMENVLHISRLFNTYCVLGMTRRAFFIALEYAKHRQAFGSPIIEYPLVYENLARIRAENTALIASIFAATKLQDLYDSGKAKEEETPHLLRLLINLNKYFSALLSVEHIHHALDVLAGNGTIETFSTIPRLLRDCIVCENWEGTHNVLQMQTLRDIEKYEIDQIYLKHLSALLEKIPAEESHIIQLKVDELKTDLKNFKTLSDPMKHLQIKELTKQMSILYAAIALLNEALDQGINGSKYLCFKLFTLLHFKKAFSYSEEYLLLTKQLSL